MSTDTYFSTRRLWALCRKESYQILRDPSSVLIAFIMPVMLLFVFGYAVNLDAEQVNLGVLNQDQGQASRSLLASMEQAKGFHLYPGQERAQLLDAMAHGQIRAILIIPADFSSNQTRRQQHPTYAQARLQLLTDGSDPNTANFVSAYVQGAWEKWQVAQAREQAQKIKPLLQVDSRTWYNPNAVSRYFLIPGAIAVVMTIIGALLTSLVVAREWERGTMEALLATPVTRLELLLSKILPYYFLGMAAMLLCLLVAVFIMGVPFRGSVLALCAISTLFLGCAMGQGLLISTKTKNQFHAAQAALTATFLPALMLSGFIFEIRSMPEVLQWFTRLIPARYLTNSLQTLFQAGTVETILLENAFYLILLMLFWLGLTAYNTKRTLE